MDRLRTALSAALLSHGLSGDASAIDSMKVAADSHPYEAGVIMHQFTIQGGDPYESLVLTVPTGRGTYRTVAMRGDSRAVYADTYRALLSKLHISPAKDSFVISQHNHSYELIAPRVETFGASQDDIIAPELILTGPSDNDCKLFKKSVDERVRFLNIVHEPGGSWFCKFPDGSPQRDYDVTALRDIRRRLFIGSQNADEAKRSAAIDEYIEDFYETVGMQVVFVPSSASKDGYSEVFFEFFGLRIP